MTKTTKIVLYVVIGIAVVGLLIAGLYQFASIIGLLGGGGVLRDYVKAEARAQQAHAKVTAEEKLEVDQAEADAKAKHDQLSALAAREAQTTQSQIQTAETEEQLSVVVGKEVAKAQADAKAWLQLTRPPEDGWARVVFVAWLLAIVLTGMLLVSSYAHAAPLTSAHRDDVLRLTKSLQDCRLAGNQIANVLVKERKQCAAKLKACKQRGKIDNAKHIKQKTILTRPSPIGGYIVVGIIASVVGAAVGAGIVYGLTRRASP